jgi:hypothetical protein
MGATGCSYSKGPKSHNFRIRFLGEFINQHLNGPLWAIRLYSSGGVKIAPNPLFIPPSQPIVGKFASVWPLLGHLFISEMLSKPLISTNPPIRFHSFF